MESLKHYFTKRYVLFFLLLFVIWYPGSFLLYIAYNVTQSGVIFVALNAYYPLLLFLFSFFYFRRSANDWNDRFLVAFGWIALTFFFSALMVRFVYGLDWTSIINIPQLEANWISFLSVLLAGLLARGSEKTQPTKILGYKER